MLGRHYPAPLNVPTRYLSMYLPCTSHCAYPAPPTKPTQHLQRYLPSPLFVPPKAPPIVPTKHIPLCLPSIVLSRSYAVDETLKFKNQLINLPSTSHCATQHLPLCPNQHYPAVPTQIRGRQRRPPKPPPRGRLRW